MNMLTFEVGIYSNMYSQVSPHNNSISSDKTAELLNEEHFTKRSSSCRLDIK